VTTASNIRYERNRRRRRFSNNAAREEAATVRLLCGHEVTGFPLAVYPNGRRLFACPEGCGLRKERAR